MTCPKMWSVDGSGTAGDGVSGDMAVIELRVELEVTDKVGKILDQIDAASLRK